jgi:hypothetical protein
MHKDDLKWIKDELLKLKTPKQRTHARNSYDVAFKEAHDFEPLPHKKDGTARRAANNRLRIYVRRVNENR